MIDNDKPRLGFFRGGSPTVHSIGAADWRIACYMSQFDTYLFVEGEPPNLSQTCGVKFMCIRLMNVGPLKSLVFSFRVAQTASKLNLDVIVCNPGLMLAGFLVKCLHPRTKLILDVRSIPVEVHNWPDRFALFIFHLILRSGRFDAVSAISPGMLDNILRRHPWLHHMPRTTWASGFDPLLFKPSLDLRQTRKRLKLEGRFVLMFHGSFSLSRGLQASVRALRVLRDQGMTDVVLLLLGDGPARNALHQLAVSLEISDQVMFLTPVPHDQVSAIITAADLGIDPLPDHPWWRHQSSLKQFEYLSMGIPVLATDLPCHQNISEAMIMIKSSTPRDIAAGIVSFRQLPSHRVAELKNRAITDAQQHSWSSRAKSFSRFITDEVLDS